MNKKNYEYCKKVVNGARFSKTEKLLSEASKRLTRLSTKGISSMRYAEVISLAEALYGEDYASHIPSYDSWRRMDMEQRDDDPVLRSLEENLIDFYEERVDLLTQTAREWEDSMLEFGYLSEEYPAIEKRMNLCSKSLMNKGSREEYAVLSKLVRKRGTLSRAYYSSLMDNETKEAFGYDSHTTLSTACSYHYPIPKDVMMQICV